MQDIIAKNIKVLSSRDVSEINNGSDEYLFSALTVEGGGVFKKGLAIGMQEKMVSGLMIYDDENENFYGFSNRHGLTLLSPHYDYNELEIPDNIFIEEEKNIIRPSNINDTFKDMTESVKDMVKNIDLELHIKDTNNFYIIIPKIYNDSKNSINFNITYIIDINTVITNMTFMCINESNKKAYFNITNENCYYEESKLEQNVINKTSIKSIIIEIVKSDCFIITTNEYIKK